MWLDERMKHPTTATHHRSLLDRELDGNLDRIVKDLRNTGDSWRTIASLLTIMTGHYVSHEALRRWYKTEPSPKEHQ